MAFINNKFGIDKELKALMDYFILKPIER